MKNFFPIISIVLVAAAGSAAGLARSKDSPSPAPLPAEDAQGTLERFCATYWGTMSSDGALCRFEQNFHFNRTHVGNELLVTSVPVIAGDTLTVLASDDVRPVVGTREYPAGAFLSDSEGYLSFRSGGEKSLFSVRQVYLRRCYSEVARVIKPLPCPK